MASAAVSRTTTGLHMLRSLERTRVTSTVIMGSPARTWSPFCAITVKPSPFRPTVSIPTWTRTAGPDACWTM